MPTNLAISSEEEGYLANANLEAFWFSRLGKQDPVARIGYALWVSDVEKLKAAIQAGDPAFWNHKAFAYWELMARSTVVNLAVGLERAGHRLTFMEMREKIREVGIEVARRHVQYVRHDIRYEIGNTPGKLSLEQMAHYHHIAFKKFGIRPDYYGGTWLGSVPDQAEMKAYGDLYCHDCDSAEGYQPEQAR
ncbi:hypothetical protein MLC59_05830 [Marinobacter bryozoorum]|uniref:hypothetical protein n=1 Tax=Marinobacter bryozoorum TaxID=256324 RepID=UPI00200354B0|nr:hypothetical protein [Marinobacter bryozoorum]MCK7543685.1 hypothetical protein [Marinobacter bryozoorum]